MPELPEVETVRRSLTPLTHQKLLHVTVQDGKLRYTVRAAHFQKVLRQPLDQISRHGKYLIFHFPCDKIVFHLGMTGRMLLSQRVRSPYTKVIFKFERDSLDFIDVRRFGFILTGAAGAKALPQSPDALATKEITFVLEKIRKSRAEIKTILLNQKVIAGLGNIYVSEILFLAKIHPASRGIDLSHDALKRISHAIPKVLKRAIESKGSSISDFVYSLPGEKEFSTGNYQTKFLVYGREGEACKVCKTTIQKITQSGRSTFFCTRCQSQR